MLRQVAVSSSQLCVSRWINASMSAQADEKLHSRYQRCRVADSTMACSGMSPRPNCTSARISPATELDPTTMVSSPKVGAEEELI